MRMESICTWARGGGRALAVAACALLLGGSAQAQAALRAEHGRLVLIEAGGARSDVSGQSGAEITLASGLLLRIDAVREARDGAGAPLWLHDLSTRDADGRWRPVCEPHSDGSTQAVFVTGRQNADGTLSEDPSGIAVSCTAGALAKCRRFGYDSTGTDALGRPRRASYNACIRMVRADYGGSGEPHTENGRVIDVFDDAGVQRPDFLAGQQFEAGWDAQGAVCVRHPRVPQRAELAPLEARYPRLRGRVGEACTEALARSLGALVFNRSTPAAP